MWGSSYKNLGSVNYSFITITLKHHFENYYSIRPCWKILKKQLHKNINMKAQWTRLPNLDKKCVVVLKRSRLRRNGLMNKMEWMFKLSFKELHFNMNTHTRIYTHHFTRFQIISSWHLPQTFLEVSNKLNALAFFRKMFYFITNEYIGRLNIHGSLMTAHNSTNNNVRLFFVSDLKIVYYNNN